MYFSLLKPASKFRPILKIEYAISMTLIILEVPLELIPIGFGLRKIKVINLFTDLNSIQIVLETESMKIVLYPVSLVYHFAFFTEKTSPSFHFVFYPMSVISRTIFEKVLSSSMFLPILFFTLIFTTICILLTHSFCVLIVNWW